MERAVEGFVAITALLLGASHVLRPGDWAEAFGQLHRCGRPGAFVNGGLCVLPAALILAGHPQWAWPGAVLTVFGWLLVVKSSICILAPNLALRSMQRGANSPRSFIPGGLALLALSGWAYYCAATRSAAG